MQIVMFCKKGFPLLLAGVFIGISVAGIHAAEESKGYLLVVHPENPVTTLQRNFVEQIFLVQQTTWHDGVPIDVVLNETTGVSEKFFLNVIRKTPGQYLIYRKKLLFNGTAIPPKRLGSDEAVIRYVASHVNSIGFISPSALDWRVKSLAIAKPADL